MKRAFTLIELLVAFGVSVMLIGVIYFFYFGVLMTQNRAQEKEFLNGFANRALERMVRELRMAESVTHVTRDEIVFQKYHVGDAPEEEAREYTGEKPQLETVTFRLKKREKDVLFERQLNFDKAEEVFVVEKCEPEIFTAYILDDHDPDKTQIPRFRLFDFTQQIGNDVSRIVLVGLRLAMTRSPDSFEIRTRVSLPAVYARLQQPSWNAQ